MPANTTPIFTLTPNIGRGRIAAANTARDGSGDLTTIFTAGTNGSRVDSVKFISAQATAAASSGMVGRVFITDNAGANPHLLQEIAITTVTPSNTAIGASQTMTPSNGWILPTGFLLKATISVYAGVQDQMDVTAFGGDY